MNVLQVHNYYGSSAPSGENQVFEAEGILLRQRNHEVHEFLRHSDAIRAKGIWGAVQGALSTPWNPFSANKIRQAVENIHPEVVHVHNTFPLLSPSIFHSIGYRAARVLTLHNYRLFCPAAIPMRAGRVCTDCLDSHSVWPSLQHGCYRNSRLATLPLAANVALHRNLGTWTKQVDAFIALTEFQRERMIEAGLPASLVHVKPNFYPGNPVMSPWPERRDNVVF
ncbi:MAG TPA: glycosyltransferase, partial [Cyclobacteriaceae bacterium]|nr:glycosyltransferase [Cyclobacteriaceae bacterium]